jgi:DNA-binding transcriptional LysR family regulator
MKPLLDVLIILDALEKEELCRCVGKALQTPSALSYTVQKLESDLNIQILDRSGHRARFTRTGQMLLEKGREVLHTVRELEKQAVKLHQGWENELVIGVDDTFPFSLLTPLIEMFYQHHSVTRLIFINGVLGGSWDALTQGRADILSVHCMSLPNSVNLVLPALACWSRYLPWRLIIRWLRSRAA